MKIRFCILDACIGTVTRMVGQGIRDLINLVRPFRPRLIHERWWPYFFGQWILRSKKVIELKETKDFLRTARKFCVFIESTKTTDEEYLRKLQSLLLTLYQNATKLPWTTIEHEEEFKEKLSKEDFDRILRVIADKVGQNRYYWEVFDPTNEKDTEAVCGDLVDDLGDIYKDMKYGLMIFDIGTLASKEDAVWDMKFGFEKHWGRHAISALKTIHFLLGLS